MKTCIECGASMSDSRRSPRCADCSDARHKAQRLAYNREHYVPRPRQPREPKQKVDHRPKPTSVIRAVTPLKDELGQLTRVDKVREITPSPVLSKHKTILHPNKNTYIFKNYQK